MLPFIVLDAKQQMRFVVSVERHNMLSAHAAGELKQRWVLFNRPLPLKFSHVRTAVKVFDVAISISVVAVDHFDALGPNFKGRRDVNGLGWTNATQKTHEVGIV